MESDLHEHKISVHNNEKNGDAQNIENSKNYFNENRKSLKCLFGYGGNDFCGAEFTLKSDLYEHKVSAHNNNKKPFKCEICRAKFSQKNILMQHIQFMHPEKNQKFPCQICDIILLSEKDLKTHISLVHEEKKPFKCGMCKSKFSEKKSLNRHMVLIHKAKKSIFKCKVCHAVFTELTDLKRHLASAHEGKFVKDEISESTKKSKLGYNIKDLKKWFECTLCSKKFESNVNLEKHLKVVHGEKKPNECPFCPFKTGLNQTVLKGLIDHVSMVHEGKKLYECSSCHYLFGYELQLREHVLVVHEKKKSPLPLSKLEKHVKMVHGEKKPYECSFCSFKTGYKLGLINHVSMVHEEKKLYDCPLCDYMSYHELQLKKHVLDVHEAKKSPWSLSKSQILNEIQKTQKVQDQKNSEDMTSTLEYPLPYGWKKVGQKKANKKGWDFYVFNPEGRKFRSNIQIKKYLEKNPDVPCDLEVTNTCKPKGLRSTPSKGKPKTATEIKPTKKAFSQFGLEPMPIIYENSNTSTIDCQSNKKGFDKTPDLVENFAPNVEIDAQNFAPSVEIDAPNFAPVPNVEIDAPNLNVEIDTPGVTENEGKLNYNYGNAQFIENLKVQCEPIEISEAGIGNSYELQTKVLEGVKSPDEMPGKIIKDPKKRFQCTLCSKKYQSKLGLERHVKIIHEEKKPYECSICPYKTGYKHQFMNHISAVHEGNKPYECTMCDFKSGYQQKLNQHISIVHDGKKSYKCSVCTFEAEYNIKLKIHFSEVHEGKNLHQCSKCNESFKVKDQLLKHTAFVHESGKFKCNSCDAQFSFKNLLKEHNVEIHGKVRTSRCSICRLAFATKPLLKQHKKFVH
jgi:stress-induced morphogen